MRKNIYTLFIFLIVNIYTFSQTPLIEPSGMQNYINIPAKFEDTKQVVDSVGYVQLITPNGGEFWQSNDIKEIKWVSSNIDNIKIEFSLDGGFNWNNILSSISASIGSYFWFVPNTQSSFCMIKITDVADSTISDKSDNVFIIPKLETEPNNTYSEANFMKLEDWFDAAIEPIGDIDYYKFSANAGDTLEIHFQNQDNTELYGFVIIFDGLGNYQGYRFYSYKEPLRFPIRITYAGNYFVRFACDWGDYPNKVLSDSFLKNYLAKTSKSPNKATQTGKYKISLKRFVPSAPMVEDVFSFDTYYNSTRIGLQFYPYGLTTKIAIEYGSTSSYGKMVESTGTYDGIERLEFYTKISELESNTLYFFRTIAENDSGITYNDEFTLLTPEASEYWDIKSNNNSFDYLSDVSFSDVNNGFAVGVSILKTTNSGNTWTEQVSGAFLDGIYSIDSINAVAVGYNGKILKTTDGGLTWISLNSNTTEYLLEVYFTSKNIGFAIGYNGTILRTSDAGTNWSKINSETSNTLNNLFFSDIKNGWIAGSLGTILKTSDGGLTWDFQNSMTSNNLLGVTFLDSLDGFAVGLDYGNILKTTDGGVNWTENYSGFYSDFYDISFLDNYNGMIVAQNGNVLLTQDGGVSWNLQKTGTYNSLKRVTKVGNNWIAVGNYGTILKSKYNLVNINSDVDNKFAFNFVQNYPNPFNPTTTISYSLPKTGFVSLKVYDLLGNELVTLVNEEKTAGSYEVEFDGSKSVSGVYFYTLTAGDFRQTNKMVLAK